MAEIITENLSRQEYKNMERIQAQKKAAKILSGFLEFGFCNYTAFKSICQYHDTSFTETELIDYWRLRKILPGVNERISKILTKLEAE